MSAANPGPGRAGPDPYGDAHHTSVRPASRIRVPVGAPRPPAGLAPIMAFTWTVLAVRVPGRTQPDRFQRRWSSANYRFPSWAADAAPAARRRPRFAGSSCPEDSAEGRGYQGGERHPDAMPDQF